MRLTESSLVVEPQAHAFVLEVVLESGLFFDHLTRMDRLANDLQKSNMRSCRNYSVSEFIGRIDHRAAVEYSSHNSGRFGEVEVQRTANVSDGAGA